MTEQAQLQTSQRTIFCREHGLKLILLCFAVWLHAASSLLAATTLPSAIRDFGGGSLIGWAFALYLLGSIVAGAGLLLILFASAASMSFMVYGPIMLETLHEISPLAAGYMIAFESVCWGGAAVIVAWIKTPNEAQLIQIGTAFPALALMGFALVMDSGPIWLILVFAGMQGAGFGVMWAFVVKRITESALEKELDKTASAIPTMQQIGFAFGAAATGIVANSSGFGEVVTAAAAQSAAFWIFVAFIPFALVACVAGWCLAK